MEVGISDDLVHEGNEASVTCRVQNQGNYKSTYSHCLFSKCVPVQLQPITKGRTWKTKPFLFVSIVFTFLNIWEKVIFTVNVRKETKRKREEGDRPILQTDRKEERKTEIGDRDGERTVHREVFPFRCSFH